MIFWIILKFEKKKKKGQDWTGVQEGEVRIRVCKPTDI